MMDELKKWMEQKTTVCVYLFSGQLGNYKKGWIQAYDGNGIVLKDSYTCHDVIIPFSSIQGISDVPM